MVALPLTDQPSDRSPKVLTRTRIVRVIRGIDFNPYPLRSGTIWKTLY
jgi:hypothetical protein